MKTLAFLLMAVALPLFGATADVQTSYKTQTEVTCDTDGEVLIAANSRRRYLLFQNKGSVTIYIKAGSVPTSSNIRLQSGEYWEMDSKVSPQAFYCISASSTAATTVVEGV